MAGKSPEAFRTISEVADWLDRPAHVLRFWESKFNQVKPVKRAGGRRYYRPEDMLLLGGIKKLLHDDGMTIKGAQKVLREQGVRYVSGLSQPLDDEGLVQVIEAVAEPEPSATVVTLHPAPPAELPELQEWQEWQEDAAEDAEADLAADHGAAPAATEVAADAGPAPDAPMAPEPAVIPQEPAPISAAPAAARPALGGDLPPAPDLDAIEPSPGLLTLIAARRGPFAADTQAALLPILTRLDDLVMRLSAGRKT